MKRSCVVVAVVMVLLAWTTVDYLQASYSWPMFKNNAQRTWKSSEGGPLVPTIKWSYDAGADVTASPVLGASDTVFIGFGMMGMLCSIDSAGSFLWSYNSIYSSGTSPAVGADKVWVVSPADGSSLYALDSETGWLSWSYLTAGGVYSSPVLNGTDTVYIGSGDNNLYSIDSLGALLWSYATGYTIRSAPALNTSTDIVYIGSSDNRLYCIDDNTVTGSPGSLLWSYETGNWIASAPALSGTDVVYFGT